MDQRCTGTGSVHTLCLTLLVTTWGLASCGGSTPAGDWDGVGTLVIEGAMVFTSPHVPPIEDGVVVVMDGVIEAVGERGRVQIPSSATRVSGTGMSLVAGFWNSHVRLSSEFLELDLDSEPAEIEALFRERFVRFGFTTLVETGTDRTDIGPLVERLDSGELRGPGIIAVGDGLVSGVHFPGAGEPPWSDEALSRMLSDDIALIPGLGLLTGDTVFISDADIEERLEVGLDQLRMFSALGGSLMFGTGAGYVPRYDPISDHLLLEEAGLSFSERLASLTTEPAARFGAFQLGELEPGMVANLVLVEGDPEVDVTAFERVRWVLRRGQQIFP